MKKLLLPGVALVLFLVMSTAVKADTFTDNPAITTGTQTATRNYQDNSNTSPQGEPMSLSKLPDVYVGRGADTGLQGTFLGARTISFPIFDGTQMSADVLLFSSNFALQNAAGLLTTDGVSLSCVSFGRIPYQQILLISKNNSTRALASLNGTDATALPEPTSLLLLGTGLAALGAGLRKQRAGKKTN